MELCQGNKNNEYKVGIAQHKSCGPPCKIITLGLGSCVGVALIDRVTGVGGMVHVMLPDSRQFSNVSNPFKYADTGINLLLEEVLKLGARKSNIYAKLAGGAQMFKSQASASLLKIGERNVQKSREVLADLGIRITGEDTGGHVGRTMILDCSQKKVFVRTVGQPHREI